MCVRLGGRSGNSDVSAVSSAGILGSACAWSRTLTYRGQIGVGAGREQGKRETGRVAGGRGGGGGRPDTAQLEGLGHSPNRAIRTAPPSDRSKHASHTHHSHATLVPTVDRSPLTRPVAGSAMPFPQTAMRAYVRTASSVDGFTHIHTHTNTHACPNSSRLAARNNTPQLHARLNGNLQQPRLQWYGPAVPYLGCCQVPLESRGER